MKAQEARRVVSIKLSPTEAQFLYDLLAYTGNGGPLRDPRDSTYNPTERRAFRRLVAMLERASRPPNRKKT